MPIDTELKVNLIEKELVDINLVEKELVDIDLIVIDVLHYHEKEIISNFILETPTKLTASKFQTSKEYTSGTLIVYLNGIKEKYITELTSTTFEFEIDTVDTDTIEVAYVEVS